MTMRGLHDGADRARFEEIAVRAKLDPVARLIVARLACVMGLVNLGDYVYRQVERCKEAITRRRLEGEGSVFIEP